jgi:hypothetical protein
LGSTNCSYLGYLHTVLIGKHLVSDESRKWGLWSVNSLDMVSNAANSVNLTLNLIEEV